MIHGEADFSLMIYRKLLFQNLSLRLLLFSLLIAQVVAAENVLLLSVFFQQRNAFNELSEPIMLFILIHDYLLNVLPRDLFTLEVNSRCEDLILAVHPLHVLLQLNHAL